MAPGFLAIGVGALGSIDLLLPQAVSAYAAEDLLTVNWVAGEDYTALARRAEDAARTMAQQRFDSDILLTRVVITVLGQNGGNTAPILVMDVNRPDWRNRPDPRYWSQYYRSTPALLGLDGVAPTGTLQAPGAAPGAPSPASTQPNPQPNTQPETAPFNPLNPPALPPGSPTDTAPGTPGSETPAPGTAPDIPAVQPAPAPASPTRPSSTRRSPGRSIQNQRNQSNPAPSLSPAPSPGPNVLPANPQPQAPSSAPNPVPASPQPSSEINSQSGQPQTGQPQIDLPAVPAGVGIPGSLR
ncbi:MAG: hypothetical protein ACKO7W_00440 [Elainella sp.]